MSELTELYQEMIIDHSKNPRNFSSLENANRVAEGHNPLCGDKVTLYLEIVGDRIQNARFQGTGCAISMASASLMTEALIGKSLAEANILFEQFRHLLTAEATTEEEIQELNKLAVFEGVREFPMRVKCASLPWHTLRSALQGKKESTTTE